jgi:hypothetical protein
VSDELCAADDYDRETLVDRLILPSPRYPDFEWGVVDAATAHTQKAFARLGYYNAGFMAGDNPKTDGGTGHGQYFGHFARSPVVFLSFHGVNHE